MLSSGLLVQAVPSSVPDFVMARIVPNGNFKQLNNAGNLGTQNPDVASGGICTCKFPGSALSESLSKSSSIPSSGSSLP